MNSYAAYVQNVPGGYRVMMRFCRDAKPRPVMDDKGRKPELYEDEGRAWKAATERLLLFMNGKPVRGEIFEAAPGPEAQWSAAEALFNLPKVREGV